MAYEMFAGKHPFDTSTPSNLIQQILYSQVNLDSLDVNETARQIIGRLLDKTSTERYQNAYDVITEITTALDQPMPQETVAIRESFLQAAHFVGRDAEVVKLTEALDQTVAGHGSAWLIGGEIGVGKSRLLDELRTRALVGGALVLHGQAVAEAGLSYQAWREPLRRLVLSTDLNDHDAAVLKQVVPDIGDLLGRPVADAPQLEGQAWQERLLTTIVTMFRSQPQPVVVLLEDLHWVTESLDIFKACTAEIKDLSLLIVGTYRDDEKPQLADAVPGAQLIKLGRLTEDSIARLSVSMLGDAGRQPELLELLNKETEGNAFFLVEVVRALAEEAGRLSQIASMSLPQRVIAGGVQQVVQHRLEGVSDQARQLLNVAAVAGRQLDLELLRAMKNDVDLDEWLAVCSNAAVLDLKDEVWRFAHDKLRDGVLTSLPADQRRPIHGQIAITLEKIYKESHDEYAAMISDHFEEAGELERAADWYVRAAIHAQQTYAPDPAINYYRKALGFWEKGSDPADVQAARKIEVYRGLGKMLSWLGRYPEAIEAYTAMRDAAEVIGDPVAQARAWNALANVYDLQGDSHEVTESATKAEQLAQAAGARLELAQALFLRSLPFAQAGDISAALALGEEALAICDEIGHRAEAAHMRNLLGFLYLISGRYDAATPHLEQALRVFQELGDRGPAAVQLGNLGWMSYARGDYRTAVERYEEALTMIREIRHRGEEMALLTNLGGARVGLGEHAAAEIELRRVIEMAATSPLGELSETYRYLAEACLGQSNVEDALDAAQEALALAKEANSPDYIAGAWRVLGQIAAETAKPITIASDGSAPTTHDARACFAESVRIAEEGEMDGERARTLREWAKHELQHGDATRGATMWQEARDLFVQLTASFEAERMSDLPAASTS
jgi:predicted ATPase